MSQDMMQARSGSSLLSLSVGTVPAVKTGMTSDANPFASQLALMTAPIAATGGMAALASGAPVVADGGFAETLALANPVAPALSAAPVAGVASATLSAPAMTAALAIPAAAGPDDVQALPDDASPSQMIDALLNSGGGAPGAVSRPGTADTGSPAMDRPGLSKFAPQPLPALVDAAALTDAPALAEPHLAHARRTPKDDAPAVPAGDLAPVALPVPVVLPVPVETPVETPVAMPVAMSVPVQMPVPVASTAVPMDVSAPAPAPFRADADMIGSALVADPSAAGAAPTAKPLSEPIPGSISAPVTADPASGPASGPASAPATVAAPMPPRHQPQQPAAQAPVQVQDQISNQIADRVSGPIAPTILAAQPASILATTSVTGQVAARFTGQRLVAAATQAARPAQALGTVFDLADRAASSALNPGLADIAGRDTAPMDLTASAAVSFDTIPPSWAAALNAIAPAAGSLSQGLTAAGLSGAPGGAASAAAGLSAPLDTLSFDSAFIGNVETQIARVAGGGQLVRMQIMPEHLGRIDIEMLAGPERDHVRIVTEHNAVRDTLIHAQVRLEQDLRTNSQRNADISVELRQQSPGTQGGSAQQQQQRGQSGPDAGVPRDFAQRPSGIDSNLEPATAPRPRGNVRYA